MATLILASDPESGDMPDQVACGSPPNPGGGPVALKSTTGPSTPGLIPVSPTEPWVGAGTGDVVIDNARSAAEGYVIENFHISGTLFIDHDATTPLLIRNCEVGGFYIRGANGASPASNFTVSNFYARNPFILGIFIPGGGTGAAANGDQMPWNSAPYHTNMRFEYGEISGAINVNGSLCLPRTNNTNDFHIYRVIFDRRKDGWANEGHALVEECYFGVGPTSAEAPGAHTDNVQDNQAAAHNSHNHYLRCTFYLPSNDQTGPTGYYNAPPPGLESEPVGNPGDGGIWAASSMYQAEGGGVEQTFEECWICSGNNYVWSSGNANGTTVLHLIRNHIAMDNTKSGYFNGAGFGVATNTENRFWGNGRANQYVDGDIITGIARGNNNTQDTWDTLWHPNWNPQWGL